MHTRFKPAFFLAWSRRLRPRVRSPMQARSKLALVMAITGVTLCASTVLAAVPVDELAEVRAATAPFHRVEAAIEDGYELGYLNGAGTRIITGCIAHATAGAMGYHYFNKALIDDLVVDVLKPEGLVYEPGPNGQLKLVAVEYVVPGPGSNPPGVSEPPTVHGVQMHILVPAVGFYIHHDWLWRHNPAGIFADWNPEVTCP
jgi:hypothetical protein